jgi:hypothetical protein
MRGTLHVIPAEDLRWVLSVTGDRQLRQDATRQRQLGIDDALIARVEGRRSASAWPTAGAPGRSCWTTSRRSASIRRASGVHLIYALNVRGILVQGPWFTATTRSPVSSCSCWRRNGSSRRRRPPIRSQFFAALRRRTRSCDGR